MSRKLSATFVAWVVSLLVFMAAMVKHDFAEGAFRPGRPLISKSELVQGHVAILRIFLHPQCGCSHATVAEIRELTEAHPCALGITFFFFIPRGYSRSWVRNDLWSEAAKIPGVRLVEDLDGNAARLSGAFTSGTVELYDGSNGKLCFSGGITPGRGQYGPSSGVASIERFIKADPLKKRGFWETAPVYGCAITTSGGWG